MNIYYGTLTSKGQTTVPAEVRELLHLKPGDRIRYIHSDGKVFIKAKNKRAIDLAGKFHDPYRTTFSLDDMDQAVGDSIAQRVAAAK
jgi:AbrB family looped-hinge helix DNA binding protein